MTAVEFLGACCVAGLTWLVASAGLADEVAIDRNAVDALAAAYPEFLTLGDDGELRWREGSKLNWGKVRQFQKVPAIVEDASLAEQFYYFYQLEPWNPAQLPADDPGRIRNEEFFAKMYGDCKRGATQRLLRTIVWLPKTAPQRLQVTTVNGIDRKLEEVSAEIEAMPPEIRSAASQLAGGFACRKIAGTRATSMHAYGAAIDLRASIGRYWRWSGLSPAARAFNRVPQELVNVFQKHGFIWGGNWYHVDSFHLEYRPELIEYAKRAGAKGSDELSKHPL